MNTPLRQPIINNRKPAKPSGAPYHGTLVELRHHVLHIPFTKTPILINSIKTLSGRKLYDEHWEVPLTLDSVDKLRAWGYKLDTGILEWLHRIESPAQILADVPGIQRPLLSYQLEGVSILDATGGKSIIGDQQGLGKTAQLLAYLQLRPELRPAVIVTTSNAKWGYYNEARYTMSTKNRVEVISGEYSPTHGSTIRRAHIYVINYDILYITKKCPVCHGKGKTIGDGAERKCKSCKGKGSTVHLRPDLIPHILGLRLVGLDECQKLQDMESLRTQAVYQLCDYLPIDDRQIVPSSGTPILHRPKNFFVPLNLVRPDLFPSFHAYGKKYCGGKQTFFGWNFDGASNQDKLNEYLKRHKVLIRRTKAEVLPELPAMDRIPVPLELSAADMTEYRRADHDFLTWLADKSPEKLEAAERAEALVKINALKQLAIHFKMKPAMAWIDDFLESGEKLIAFAHHKATVSLLRTKFKALSVVVDGGTTDVQKRDAETRFQACRRCGIKKDKHDIEPGACKEYLPNKTQLFIGTLAAKEALTLTAASDTVFLELWDSPKDHSQAEERCYGRVSDPHGATSYYLLAKGTIEEEILESHDIKNRNIDAIIDGKSMVEAPAMLADFLNTYKHKRR